MRSGIPLALVIVRGKLRTLSAWAGGSSRAIADGSTMLAELGRGRVRDLCELGAEDWRSQSSALFARWAKLVADWEQALPAERMRQADDLIGLCDKWLAVVDDPRRPSAPSPAQSGGLAPLPPSLRALFLRGEHAQTYGAASAVTSIGGRRLAAWCLERASGVAPQLRVGGVTYWVALADGKARAFSRHEISVARPGGGTVGRVVWRAIAAPNGRLLKMRLASRAGVSVDAVETWPTFEDEAKQ